MAEVAGGLFYPGAMRFIGGGQKRNSIRGVTVADRTKPAEGADRHFAHFILLILEIEKWVLTSEGQSSDERGKSGHCIIY